MGTGERCSERITVGIMNLYGRVHAKIVKDSKLEGSYCISMDLQKKYARLEGSYLTTSIVFEPIAFLRVPIFPNHRCFDTMEAPRTGQ